MQVSSEESNSAVCSWPGINTVDWPRVWTHAIPGETQKKLLALAWPSPNCYSHLGSEPMNGKSLFFPLTPSVNLDFQINK